MVNVGMRIVVFVGRQDLVLQSGESRQLVQKRHHRPHPLIIVGRAPGRHPAHLHPMLNDPECFGRIAMFHRRHNWQLWIHRSGEFRVLDAGLQVTVRTHLVVVDATSSDHRWRSERRDYDPAGVRRDRMVANRLR